METYTFDDGSTLTFPSAGEVVRSTLSDGPGSGYGAWYATPADAAAGRASAWPVTSSSAATIVQTGAGDTGFFDILDSFAGAVTKVGGTVTTLQGQVSAVEMARQRNELERYRTLAAIQVGKSQADVAAINAQRDVALARQNLSALTSGGGLTTLLILGGLAFVAMKAAA